MGQIWFWVRRFCVRADSGCQRVVVGELRPLVGERERERERESGFWVRSPCLVSARKLFIAWERRGEARLTTGLIFPHLSSFSPSSYQNSPSCSHVADYGNFSGGGSCTRGTTFGQPCHRGAATFPFSKFAFAPIPTKI